MPRCVADFFIVHGFVVNSAVLLCGFKQTKGKRHENSDSLDRTAAGISGSVPFNSLWPVVAGGGGMKEALKLALEFVSDIQRGKYKGDAEEVITAINQALAAQPEQEPVAWRYDLKQTGSFAGVSTEYSRIKLKIGENWTPLYTTPPAQPAPVEPVAWVTAEDVKVFNTVQGESVFLFQKNGKWNVPLYTTPLPQARRQAAQRTWVGLTPTERKQIEKRYVFVEDAIRLTEAKLKEKNT
jgi:hypothetical protein